MAPVRVETLIRSGIAKDRGKHYCDPQLARGSEWFVMNIPSAS